MRSKGYNNTYRCTLIGTTANRNICDKPLFHVFMWFLICTFFTLAVTTKYSPEPQDRLLPASIL